VEVNFYSRFFLLVLCLITHRDVLTFNLKPCKFVAFKVIWNVTLKNSCHIVCDAVYSGECYVFGKPVDFRFNIRDLFSKDRGSIVDILEYYLVKQVTEWRLAPCVLNTEATWW